MRHVPMVWVLLGALVGASNAQPVTYDFSGTLADHFEVLFDDPGIHSAQGGGVLRIDTADTLPASDEAVDGYLHKTFTPGYDQSWTASVGFDFPLVYDTNFVQSETQTQDLRVGIAAVADDGLGGFHAFSHTILVRSSDNGIDPAARTYHAEVSTSGAANDSVHAPADGVSTGRLVLRYNAFTRELTASDAGGVEIFTADLDGASSDWGMTGTDTFQVALFTSSFGRVVFAATPLSMDDFSAELLEPDVTYDFAGVLSENFTPIIEDEEIVSSQGAGVLRFDSAGVETTRDRVHVYGHNTFTPRFDQSWAASVEFDLPLVYDSNFTPSTVDGKGIGVGIGALFTDGVSFFDGFAASLEVWSDGSASPDPRRQYYTSLFISQNDFPESEVAAGGVSSGTLRLAFDAATRVITATDAGGAVLLSADLDAPGTDLGMGDSDTFTLVVFGAIENRAVLTGTPIWVDNFSASVLGGEPECPADTNGDGFLDSGDIGTFIALFLNGDPAADFNGDGFLDTGDIGTFVQLFLAGC